MLKSVESISNDGNRASPPRNDIGLTAWVAGSMLESVSGSRTTRILSLLDIPASRECQNIPQPRPLRDPTIGDTGRHESYPILYSMAEFQLTDFVSYCVDSGFPHHPADKTGICSQSQALLN